VKESESRKNDKLRYLLDTSALMTLSEDEPGAQVVSDILMKAQKGDAYVYISFISVMEACYKVHQEKGEEAAGKMFHYLSHLPVKRIDVDDQLILSASSVKAQYTVSMADAWILATAKSLDAKLVHKDPEFEQLKETIFQIILPYKSSKLK